MGARRPEHDLARSRAALPRQRELGRNHHHLFLDGSEPRHCGRDLDAVPAVRRRQGVGCLRCVRAGGLSARKRRAITPAGGALAAPMPDKGDFGSSESHATLPGGERVLIRRARPEDVALYRNFLTDVSAEDLRLRFFAHVAELSSEESDKLSHLDYRHEMAFIALDEGTRQMLGLVRLKDELDEKTAEFAILVSSRVKGHGLGWLLMQRVIDYAKAKGLRRVYGDVLAEN